MLPYYTVFEVPYAQCLRALFESSSLPSAIFYMMIEKGLDTHACMHYINGSPGQAGQLKGRTNDRPRPYTSE